MNKLSTVDFELGRRRSSGRSICDHNKTKHCQHVQLSSIVFFIIIQIYNVL